jgi:hypothetical protein
VQLLPVPIPKRPKRILPLNARKCYKVLCTKSTKSCNNITKKYLFLWNNNKKAESIIYPTCNRCSPIVATIFVWNESRLYAIITLVAILLVRRPKMKDSLNRVAVRWIIKKIKNVRKKLIILKLILTKTMFCRN